MPDAQRVVQEVEAVGHADTAGCRAANGHIQPDTLAGAVHAGDVDKNGAPRDVHDSQEVVIDEVVGYLVAFTWLPMNWTSVVTAFVLFRALDIVKPFPISWLDRKVKGGLGTVVDDLAAGLVANIILQAVL